jgi:hypothetical protein
MIDSQTRTVEVVAVRIKPRRRLVPRALWRNALALQGSLVVGIAVRRRAMVKVVRNSFDIGALFV